MTLARRTRLELSLSALWIWGGAWALFWIVCLFTYKTALVNELTGRVISEIRPLQAKIFELQSRRQDLSASIGAPSGFAELRGLQLVGHDQRVIFDSRAPSASSPNLEPGAATLIASVQSGALLRGTRLLFWIPEKDGSGVVYVLDGRPILLRLCLGLILGIAIFGMSIRMGFRRDWRLRTQFVATIVGINIITAGIIFWGLSSLQKREQTSRIERQSVLYARFSTERIVRLFVDSFSQQYFEVFLPGLENIIAGNDDLTRLRILSVRSGGILFDSDLREGQGSQALIQMPDFPQAFLEQIQGSDLASRSYAGPDGKWFSVVSTFRGPTQEALFRVEFLYGYHSLEESLALIRREILVDLMPAVALGTLIALAFAQILIAPIRRLVSGLRRVAGGDYTASVDAGGAQEVRELIGAFNAMTGELRRKEELRKYLSNFSYEQITAAAEKESTKLGGMRVAATVLFSDIRDFVSLCESMEAEEVTTLLNAYFSEMVGVIQKNGGEVDKFIGDAILAVFYPQPGAASEASTSLQALYCALDMRTRLASFNEVRVASGRVPIEIGVGISFGQVISGPIGAENRMDFTVIGDVVNVASRVEKLSKEGRHTKIFFSGGVEDQVRGLLDYEEFTGTKIRGKLDEVRVFELIGIKELGTLVQNLESPEAALRRRSLELLAQAGNPRAIDPAVHALEDSDDQVRILAAAALARLAPLNDERCFNAVLKRLKTETSPKVSSALVASAGKICRNERILELAPLLASPHERVVANAVEAIGKAKSAAGTDLILSLLGSRNHRIKGNAAMAAFAAGRFEVIDILRPMLMHSDPGMRSSAAFAIGELTRITDLKDLVSRMESDPTQTKQVLAELQGCVPMLIAMLRDPEASVKRQAIIALGKIRDKSAVLPLIGLTESPETLPDVLDALRAIGSHRMVRDLLEKLSS